MNQTEKRRAFIIHVLYIALWAVLIYCALKYLLPLFMPFCLAFCLAFVLKPVINKLTKIMPFGRKATAVIVLTLVYIIIGGLLTLVGIKLFAAISGWMQNLPTYYAESVEPAFANLTSWLDGYIAELDPVVVNAFNTVTDSISQTVSGLVSSISSRAVGAASSVTWFVAGFFFFLISSYFFVFDYYQVTSFLTLQLNPNARRKLFVIKDYVVGTLFKYIRAYAILLSITFIEVLAGLLILRVENAIAIAALTAAVDILPVFGTGTIMLPWAAYQLFMGDYFLGIGLLVVYAIITVVRQVLEPKVVGKQIGLYPLLTLICMFIGTRLFGFWGLFAFPITLTVLVHLNREGEINLFREERKAKPEKGSGKDSAS